MKKKPLNMKDAFFAGYEACFNADYYLTLVSWTVLMERAWGEYMLALEREERKAREDDEIDKALGLTWEEEEKLKNEPDPMNITITKETLLLPEALEEHSKYCPNGWGYQREHDRLMLQGGIARIRLQNFNSGEVGNE